MPEFVVKEGGLQQRFLQSTAKVQFFGGGFANGKTSGGVVKGINIALDYPGSIGLIARETEQKVNKSVRREFEKWMPKGLIKKFPKSNKDNYCELTNGSIVQFGYVRNMNKASAAQNSTNNLLSMTLDWALIDQVEDPLITYEDFMHVFGRLRGNAEYIGDDPKMPRRGPRWFILTANPTRNWVWKKLVKPIKDYQAKGIVGEDLSV